MTVADVMGGAAVLVVFIPGAIALAMVIAWVIVRTAREIRDEIGRW